MSLKTDNGHNPDMPDDLAEELNRISFENMIHFHLDELTEIIEHDRRPHDLFKANKIKSLRDQGMLTVISVNGISGLNGSRNTVTDEAMRVYNKLITDKAI